MPWGRLCKVVAGVKKLFIISVLVNMLIVKGGSAGLCGKADVFEGPLPGCCFFII